MQQTNKAILAKHNEDFKDPYPIKKGGHGYQYGGGIIESSEIKTDRLFKMLYISLGINFSGN